jgi:hypothetical protein
LSNLSLAKQALLKLMVAMLAIVGSVQVFRHLLLPAIQTLFDTSESTTSIIRRTGIFLAVLFAYWAYVRLYEKRAATELRFSPAAIALGAASGALLISITTVTLFALGVYELTNYRGMHSQLLGVAGLILVAAFLEEVVYRGVLFRILEDAWGTSVALWLQALVFAAMHLGNAPASNSELLTTMVAGTLIGAFWACLYVQTRSLWVVSANHAAWNFAIILSGVPLSGIEDWRALAPIESRYNGPGWLTGGVFGPEDSIITLAVISLSVAGLLHWSRKTKRLVAARPARAPAPEPPCPT